ncbi:MAG: ubiquinol-cytochrome c reductase iron-sulfur subunit [Woeseiaceae bacterium]
MNRRTVLTRLAVIVGGVAAAFAAVPFVRYLYPSERAKALGSPVSIDISLLQPGETRSYVWRGRTVLVIRRTRSQIDALSLTDGKLLDDSDPKEQQPEYVDSSHRALKSEFLVLLGNCTHLGCVPGQNLERGRSLLGDWWPGGFVCACHGSMFDYAGRLVRGPAPVNLPVPPHWYPSESTLIVGEDEPELNS